MNESSSSVEAKVVSFMDEKKFDEILLLLKEDATASVVENDDMNLISAICRIVKWNDEILKEPLYLTICSDILLYLIEKGKPKEALIGLMESADTFKDDQYFSFLLLPLQKAFMRLPGKRGKSLEWMLDNVTAHISTLPLPANQNLEGEELLLMDLDPAVSRTATVISDYLNFLKPFIEEVSIPALRNKTIFYSDRIFSQRQTLQKYLLQMLDYPLLFHDLHCQPGRSKSSIQALCCKIVGYLKVLCTNYFVLDQPTGNSSWSISSADGDSLTDEHVPNMAFINLTYLIFVEQLADDFRPYVYSYSFLFMKCLAPINSLLQKSQHLANYKGLKLCDLFMQHISEFELGQYCETKTLVSLSRSLLQIAIYSRVKEYRSLAVKSFKDYLKKFKWKERYIHIMYILTSFDHSGVHGLLINMYKDFLVGSCKNTTNAEYFTGKNLHNFLRFSVHLKHGAETDILENYDKILSGLNFIRFLVLFDKREEDNTGIWSMLDDLVDKFFEPLHRGIELTRAHYKLEEKKLAEESRETKMTTDLNTTVMVNGELLPNLPPDQRADMMQTALLTLDMIESILSRVKDFLG